MKEISVEELNEKLTNKETVFLVDVRESYERDIVSITEHHIPMGEILDRANELPKDVPVVVHCRSGQRSAAVIDALEREHQFSNLYNLSGGILDWAEKIDPSLSKY